VKIIEKLQSIWKESDQPFLIHKGREMRFADIAHQTSQNLSIIKPGDVVAVVGDFDPESILTLLMLIDKGVIIVPLTSETSAQHQYFFDSALVDFVVNRGSLARINHGRKHELIEGLRQKGHSGLILFSTGTTGRPKAILHDLTLFLKRFETPRPTLRTLNFLLFDHIGGINTLLHTLFNKGVVVAPETRSVESILEICKRYSVEVLPTTPTFLRMMLMSGAVPGKVPGCLNVITYGTERMDQPTLNELCNLLPHVDFRQTFGMSELGIVRVKSEARDSLFMRIGGEGVETRVVDGVLEIRSQTKMLGYLNAPSPFNPEGWYNTKDVVEVKGDMFKVVGRVSDVINVGGLKFMASEVERVILSYPNVSFAKVIARLNPITGQHVEAIIQPTVNSVLDKDRLIKYLRTNLQPHMTPKRVVIEDIAIGHRFKKV